MADHMSLAELKAENEKAENNNDQYTEEVKEELEQEELPENNQNESEELESLDESEDEQEEGDSEEDNKPSWLEEDANSTVPVSSHIELKRKLKGKVKERDTEIEALRAEIEQMKAGGVTQQAPAPQTASSPMPTLEQFDYDDAAHAQAVQAWVNDQVTSQINNQLSVAQQTQQQTQAEQQRTQKINDHYERAGKLLVDHGIEEAAYVASEQAVRNAISDDIFDALIATVGEDSEKIAYSLGRNKSRLATLQQKLASDPSGLQAAVYLGELKTSFNAPAKKVTKAPKPAAQIKGDKPTGTSSSLQRKYKAMHKAGNANDAFKIKRQAKKAGVDTSKW